jgi:PAS domain S-box-containing protein
MEDLVIFNALPIPVLLVDTDGRIQAVNPAFTALTGFAAAESIGLDAGLGDILGEVTRCGTIWRGEWVCPRKSDSAFRAQMTVARAGTRFVATIEEVTRQDGATTTPGERDFDLFFNLIPDLACIAHVDGYFKKVNPAWEKTLGYTQEEVLSRPFLDLVHPDDIEMTADERARQNRFYRTRHFVNRYRAKDGSYRLLEWQSTFNRDEFTRFGVARDITEQRQWEDSLRESEERFRIMADSCPTIIWVTGADGRLRLSNRMCREFFGPAFDRAESPADASLLHPDDRDEYAGGFLRAVQERTSFRGEARVRRADGEWRWIHSYAEPRLSASGDFLGHAGISPDITERKEAEHALHTAKQAAEAANRAKGEFLANMSHEIRTPMSAVIGLTDLMLETELAPDQRGYMEGVKHSAEALLRILNDILDFSKIEAGRLDFEIIGFDLHRVVESSLKVLGVRAMAKGLELTGEVAPEAPGRLSGDPARLRQILFNIVGNAIKFTDRGEVGIRVGVRSQTDEDVELHFSVRDTGIGIPPDKQQQVFSPFVQADSSTTRQFGGTGLGLTISAQLVDLMRGRMWIESEEGSGSTFHFTARFGIDTASLGDERPPDLSDLAGRSVLVVDDNDTNRQLLGRILSRAGLQTTLADSGAAALAALQAAAQQGDAFALLVLDLQMPGMDGFAVLERIQADPQLSGTRIALLSSGVRPGDAARAREFGVSVHLSKPVGEVELLDAVRQGWNHGPRASVPRPASAQPTGETAPLRILVVEDNPVNRLLATRLVEKQNHTVTAATNGREALERLEAETFDCVLMDVQMPVMDGLEATAAIRRKERDTGGFLPVIAMTAHAMAGDLERCLAAGMDGYVTKPVSAADLFATIENVMRRRKPVPPEGRSGGLGDQVGGGRQ